MSSRGDLDILKMLLKSRGLLDCLKMQLSSLKRERSLVKTLPVQSRRIKLPSPNLYNLMLRNPKVLIKH